MIVSMIIALVFCAPTPETFPISFGDIAMESFHPFETVWSTDGFGFQNDKELEFLGTLINKMLDMAHGSDQAREFLDFYLDSCSQASPAKAGSRVSLESTEKLYWLLANSYLVPYTRTKGNNSFDRCLNSHTLLSHTIEKIKSQGLLPENSSPFLTSISNKAFGMLDMLESNGALSDHAPITRLEECLAAFEQACEYQVERLTENPTRKQDAGASVPKALEQFELAMAELVQAVVKSSETTNKGACEPHAGYLVNTLGIVHSFMSMINSFFLESCCVEDSFVFNLSRFANKCTMHILKDCCTSFAEFYIILIDFYDKKLRPVVTEKESGEIKQLYTSYISKAEAMPGRVPPGSMTTEAKLHYFKNLVVFNENTESAPVQDVLESPQEENPDPKVTKEPDTTSSRKTTGHSLDFELSSEPGTAPSHKTAGNSLLRLKDQVRNLPSKFRKASAAIANKGSATKNRVASYVFKN